MSRKRSVKTHCAWWKTISAASWPRAKTGELQAAPSYGKPLDYGDGYFETPEHLRMGFKLLKDGGYVPPEVELMQEIEALRRSLEAAPDAADASLNHKRLSQMRQRLAMQLEQLRGSSAL